MNQKFVAKKINESRIMMRLPLRANLKISILELRKRLKQYPNFHSFSYGKQASYYAVNGEELFIFHFLKDSIIHEVYPTTSPVYLLKESLLRLLGIVLFLQDAYQIYPESIFPYIIAELSKQELESIPRKSSDKRINSEVILSKRIIGLLEEVKSLSLKNTKSESTILLLAARLLIKEAQNGLISIAEISNRYSLDKEIFDSATKILDRFGYRAVYQNPDKFNLVNI